MSEPTTEPETEPETELEAAIAENPEAVAGFVRRLDLVNEMLDVVALGDAAMTDEMARDVADTTATLAESADELATDGTVALAGSVGENGEELAAAVESMAVLQRTGALDDLVELASVASLLTAALDDEMVASLAGTGASLGELADTAADGDTRQGIETLLSAVGDAERDATEPVGAIGMLRATRDPDVQQGFGYLLALAGALGRARTESGTAGER